MPAKKRARKAASSSSSSTAATVQLTGGHACPPPLVELWHSSQLCDVTVTVAGDTQFSAHKVVLAAGSPFLRGIFTSGMRDCDAPTLPEVSAAAFAKVLEFVYLGEATVEEEALSEVLRAACFLQVEALQAAAIKAITRRVGPENALGVWSMGEQQGLEELASKGKQAALEHFEELGASLLTSPIEVVQALVAEETLTARSEEAVFTTVAAWHAAQEPPPEEAAMLSLLRHVRFANCRRQFLEQTVRPWPLLQTKAGQSLLFDAFLGGMFGDAPAPRLGLSAKKFIVLGGHGDTILASVEEYDPQTGSWTALAPMPTSRQGFAAAVLGGKLFAVGGYVGGECTTAVECFDPRTAAWATVASMNTKRAGNALVAVGGMLYAIGGYDGDNVLASVEAFDPSSGTNGWVAVAPMAAAHRRTAAAVVGDKIYVVSGGGAGGELLATVEVFDPRMGAWAAAAPMTTPRCSCCAVALKGKLYAIGGQDANLDALDSVEVYDPATNAWSPVASMGTTRRGSAAAVVQGKLYVTGGINGHESFLTSSEVYDPELDQWSPGADLRCPRFFHSMVSL